jgi:hypothetical protein
MPDRKAKCPFDVHPAVAMVKKWVADLPAKTGRSLDEWSAVARTHGGAAPKRADIVDTLKTEYGLGTITCWQIYEYTWGQATWEGDDATYLANAVKYVDDQYRGAKAHFRPLFDAVMAHVRASLPGVKVCPCKTIVPFYRDRVFAEVRPATKTRFELCLALESTPYMAPLMVNPRAKGNNRLRHMIALTGIDDFNATAKKWLKKAYEMDA